MSKWHISLLLRKEQSLLSETDIEAIVQNALEYEFSDEESKAKVLDICVRDWSDLGDWVISGKVVHEKIEPHLLPSVEKILGSLKGQYYLQDEGVEIPVCWGCFNEKGPCGTPCVDCERKKAWDKDWAWDMMLEGKYMIWRKKKKRSGFIRRE